jgi:DNA-binding YbaB/EbfC family protein
LEAENIFQETKMKNPFGNMSGMGGLGDMMKQAKKMYEDVQKTQEELAAARFEAASGGGMVKVVASGTGEILELKIDPQVIDPEDAEMLEDLVITAVREALAKAKEMEVERMQAATGGINLPGMLGG